MKKGACRTFAAAARKASLPSSDSNTNSTMGGLPLWSRFAEEAGKLPALGSAGELARVSALVDGRSVDFIETDGTVSLSLEVSNATVNATDDTLSCTVADTRWADGDELMVRIRAVP